MEAVLLETGARGAQCFRPGQIVGDATRLAGLAWKLEDGAGKAG